MKLIILAAASIAVIAAVVAFLPSQFTLTRHALIDATPEEIYPRLTSTEGFQTFNPYKDADDNLKITPFGPESGLGAGFHFDGKDGKGSSTIVALETNRSVTMRIDMGAMGKPVQTLRLEPVGEQTKVTWEVDMQFGMNPAKRVFGLFADKLMGETYQRGLTNLDRVVTN